MRLLIMMFVLSGVFTTANSAERVMLNVYTPEMMSFIPTPEPVTEDTVHVCVLDAEQDAKYLIEITWTQKYDNVKRREVTNVIFKFPPFWSACQAFTLDSLTERATEDGYEVRIFREVVEE